MECKDCVNFKDCKNVTEEVCEDFKFNADSELVEDNITSITPEETDAEETEETVVKTDTEKLKESINDLVNSVSDVFKKGNINIKTNPQPAQKKPFKIGFWGYLTIGAIIKGAVEITRAITDARRPRR